MPTFLSLAGREDLTTGLDLDGLDMVDGLRRGEQIRTNVLLDLYTERTSHDGKSLATYRKGDYKVISGSYKDSHWYSEPTMDWVATTDTGLLARLFEVMARMLDWLLGEGPCDSIRMLMFNIWLFNHYSQGNSAKTLLFNIAKDPEERRNLADEFPEIVTELLKEVEVIKQDIPASPRYWMVSYNWTNGFVKGDCSGQSVLPGHYCHFTSHWLPDTANLQDEEMLGLQDIAAEATRKMILQLCLLLLLLLVLGLGFFLVCKRKQNIQDPDTRRKDQ